MDYNELRQRLKDQLLKKKEDQMHPYAAEDLAAFKEEMMPQAEADARKEEINTDLFRRDWMSPTHELPTKEHTDNYNKTLKNTEAPFLSFAPDFVPKQEAANNEYSRNRDLELLERDLIKRKQSEAFKKMIEKLKKGGLTVESVDE